MKRVLEAIWIATDRSEGGHEGRKALEMQWLIEIVSDRACGIDLLAIDSVASSDAPQACAESMPLFRRGQRKLHLHERLATLYPSASKSRA